MNVVTISSPGVPGGAGRRSLMPQSFASILVHLIYSPKNREPWLTPALDPELYAYQAAVIDRIEKNWPRWGRERNRLAAGQFPCVWHKRICTRKELRFIMAAALTILFNLAH